MEKQSEQWNPCSDFGVNKDFATRYSIAEQGGTYREKQDHPGMHRVQAEKLQHNEEQEERSGQNRAEKVLQVLW